MYFFQRFSGAAYSITLMRHFYSKLYNTNISHEVLSNKVPILTGIENNFDKYTNIVEKELGGLGLTLPSVIADDEKLTDEQVLEKWIEQLNTCLNELKSETLSWIQDYAQIYRGKNFTDEELAVVQPYIQTNQTFLDFALLKFRQQLIDIYPDNCSEQMKQLQAMSMHTCLHNIERQLNMKVLNYKMPELFDQHAGEINEMAKQVVQNGPGSANDNNASTAPWSQGSDDSFLNSFENHLRQELRLYLLAHEIYQTQVKQQPWPIPAQQSTSGVNAGNNNVQNLIGQSSLWSNSTNRSANANRQNDADFAPGLKKGFLK